MKEKCQDITVFCIEKWPWPKSTKIDLKGLKKTKKTKNFKVPIFQKSNGLLSNSQSISTKNLQKSKNTASCKYNSNTIYGTVIYYLPLELPSVLICKCCKTL